MFDAQVPELARTHRVVRYDLRGHGGSEVVPGPATVDDLARDVLALLDGLGIDRFSYAGVSLGGAVGLPMALAGPGRLDRPGVPRPAAPVPAPPALAAR